MAKLLTREEKGFPKWNPHLKTERYINSFNFKKRYKALRNSSSGFISRKDVREYIFKRDGYKCVICNHKDSLQVDHIVSVWQATKEKNLIKILNTETNLRTICSSCNAGRKP